MDVFEFDYRSFPSIDEDIVLCLGFFDGEVNKQTKQLYDNLPKQRPLEDGRGEEEEDEVNT